MNRELKFRIWSKVYQEMLYPKGPTKNKDYEEKIYLQLDGVLMGDFKHTGIVNCSEDYVIQQYTGFKDSKGNEVYEGDIVTYNLDHTIYYQQVKWGYDGWVMEDDWDSNPLINNLPDIEVIGNIFEQPELLNK